MTKEIKARDLVKKVIEASIKIADEKITNGSFDDNDFELEIVYYPYFTNLKVNLYQTIYSPSTTSKKIKRGEFELVKGKIKSLLADKDYAFFRKNILQYMDKNLKECF